MKTFTDETRKRMSDSAKRRCADPSWLAPATRKWKPFCTEQELRDGVSEGMRTEVPDKQRNDNIQHGQDGNEDVCAKPNGK